MPRLLRLACCLPAMVAVSRADPPAPEPGVLRVATYNVSLYRRRAGELASELASGESRQAQRLAEVIQRVRPHVLLLCEIDYDPEADPPGLFADRYVSKPQADGLRGIDYPHRFTAPTNTGDPSGIDLDGDGDSQGPNDCWGYGRYPGQYGMAVLSRYPIDREATRTFQRLLWSELPDARRPAEPATGEPFHSEDVWRRLRLPSKSFWDVVVSTPSGPLHVICSHPTPPVFDGPEDRNGCRNADEIRLVTEYVEGGLGSYFVDQRGVAGALADDAAFVALGDLNADPADGDGHGAVKRLLASERLAQAPTPTSEGAVAAARWGAALNSQQRGDPAADTAYFGGDGVSNLRVDYALASKPYRSVRNGVYWPKPGEPGADAIRATDHRVVWVDIARAE